MVDTAECPGCIGSKAGDMDLCRACYDEYGRDRMRWPGWLLFLVNDNKRIKYTDILAARNEIPFGPFEPGEEADDLPGELTTRPIQEMGRSRRPGDIPAWMDQSGEMLLPYAPYEDEALNRQYRKANGIYARA